MRKLYLILFFLIISCAGLRKGSSPIAQKVHNAVVKNNVADSLSRIHKVNSNAVEKESEMSGYGVGSGMYSLESKSYAYKPKPSLKIIKVDNSNVIKKNSTYSSGRIVYKIPDKMKVRTPYKVFVRISKSSSSVSIYDSLSGSVTQSDIPVTETMEVRLIDLSSKQEPAFDIVEGNSAVQIIELGDVYTEWSWSVTPLHVGNSKLRIVVSVINDNKKKDVVYEDTVDVQKDIWVQISFFLSKYWQWVFSLLIPFAIWLFKRKKDDKNT